MATDTDATGWSANLYNKHANFVYAAKYTASVVSMLAPLPGEKIMDFGCGSGELTKEIVAVVEQAEGGVVMGVDSSESMIDAAKRNGLANVYVADIQSLPDSSDVKYDAVFTNATLHWCKRDPRGVLQSAKRVLKPGGRFVGEMGGFMNCIGLRSALYRVLQQRGYDPAEMDPWFFPSAEDYTQLLKSESFEPIEVLLVPRFTPLPSNVLGWQQTFVRGSFLHELSDEEAESIMKEVQDICSIDCKDSQGNWAMMYMRLRFSAVLKE